MKKIILALFLIGFLAVPNIALGGGIEFEFGGITISVDVCEDLGNSALCGAAIAAGFDCHWDGTNCVAAADHANDAGVTGEIEVAPKIPPLGALDTIINVLFTVLVIVAVIFIILGAFALLTAQGDEDKIKTGRQQILYAVIAVVVALLARGIVDWVRGLF